MHSANTLKRAAKRVALSLTVILTVAFVSIRILIFRPFEAVLPVASGDYLYYFAYGSNMPARYLANVRRVDVYESAPGLLADHNVQFAASGLAFLEPAFANLVPAEGHSAFGVLHLIDASSLLKIVCSEPESYAMVQRDVKRLDSGATIRAWTLVGESSPATNIPSRRYLNLLLEGAAAHHLPMRYRSRLARQASAYVPLVSELAGTLIYARVMLQATTSASDCRQRRRME